MWGQYMKVSKEKQSKVTHKLQVTKVGAILYYTHNQKPARRPVWRKMRKNEEGLWRSEVLQRAGFVGQCKDFAFS